MDFFCKNCDACQLFKNQPPIVENHPRPNVDIMWVGLSAKKWQQPLSLSSRSGLLIAEAEDEYFPKLLTYKTNLVKCLPLDSAGKIRYPSKEEIRFCIENLDREIKFLVHPHIVFLLGNIVSSAVFQHLGEKSPKVEGYSYSWIKKDGVFYVPIQHPSYISTYKKKEASDYRYGIYRAIVTLINCR